MDLSRSLIDWSHGSHSACYRLGSNLYRGRKATASEVEECLNDLRWWADIIKTNPDYTTEDRADLAKLIKEMTLLHKRLKK